MKALQIQGPTKNHESIKKSDAQLHPHWLNLGIIESLGHSKGIGGRTFQQNRSLVQAWGSWWLVIGRVYIELGSAAKFGWVLQRLPSFSVQKRPAICGEFDWRRIRWSIGISSVDHVEQFFKCQKLAAGCLATRARRWEAGRELYPVRFPVYWLLIMKPTKTTTKPFLECWNMLKVLWNMVLSSQKEASQIRFGFSLLRPCRFPLGTGNARHNSLKLLRDGGNNCVRWGEFWVTGKRQGMSGSVIHLEVGELGISRTSCLVKNMSKQESMQEQSTIFYETMVQEHQVSQKHTKTQLCCPKTLILRCFYDPILGPQATEDAIKHRPWPSLVVASSDRHSVLDECCFWWMFDACWMFQLIDWLIDWLIDLYSKPLRWRYYPYPVTVFLLFETRLGNGFSNSPEILSNRIIYCKIWEIFVDVLLDGCLMSFLTSFWLQDFFGPEIFPSQGVEQHSHLALEVSKVGKGNDLWVGCGCCPGFLCWKKGGNTDFSGWYKSDLVLLVCKVADALGEETRSRQKDQKVRWSVGSWGLVQDLLGVLTIGRFGAGRSVYRRKIEKGGTYEQVKRYTFWLVISFELILYIEDFCTPGTTVQCVTCRCSLTGVMTMTTSRNHPKCIFFPTALAEGKFCEPRYELAVVLPLQRMLNEENDMLPVFWGLSWHFDARLISL